MSENTYQPITPYYAALVTAAALERAGSTRKPPTTQSMYTRARKGTITSFTDNHNKVYFDGAAFAEWLKGYVSSTPTAKVDIDALADQYAL